MTHNYGRNCDPYANKLHDTYGRNCDSHAGIVLIQSTGLSRFFYQFEVVIATAITR